jgi:hypothetical protein
MDFPTELNNIYDYFFANYIGDFINESATRYHIRIWHCLENLDNDYPRNNNVIEGWHAVFRSTFSTVNISANTLVKKLQDEEAIMQKYIRITNGEVIHRRRSYFRTDKNLKNFVDQYDGSDDITFIFTLGSYIYY